MSRYIHDKTQHQLIPVSGYGSRVATSIEDKTLTVHGSFVNIEGYNYGKADITDAVELIAPIESELVASRAYTVGKQFVYRGFLYKVTAPIALDEAIVIGTNCELAPDVTEQISDLKTDVDSIPRVVIKTLAITNKTADAAGNIALNPLSINNCIPLAFTPNSVGSAIRSWRFGSYSNTLYLIWSNGNETISGTVYYIDK